MVHLMVALLACSNSLSFNDWRINLTYIHLYKMIADHIISTFAVHPMINNRFNIHQKSLFYNIKFIY